MDIAQRYVRLAHGIQLHHHGFIDSYCGQPEWSKPLSTSLDNLETEALRLETDVTELQDQSRRQFLQTQQKAMLTMIQLARGDTILYTNEVRGLYDIEPIRIPDTELDQARELLETLLPGTGSMTERREKIRGFLRIAPNHLPAVLEAINHVLRSRTKEIFDLPTDESIQFKLVQNKPWSGYNWYLGNAQSRVEINTDLPVYGHQLPNLVAHEGYPGHHTERVFKHQLIEKGWLEHTVQLLNAPEAVLAEGIATNALEFLMTPTEIMDWIVELAPTMGIKTDLTQIQQVFNTDKAIAKLSGAIGNAALKLHQDGIGRSEILEYIMHYTLSTLEQAEKRLEFISHPNSRSYTFNYSVGYDLVRKALERGNREEIYSQLLKEPITPSQLRNMGI
jgi:hypothetical protein